jgi:RimJ/RimL family protein N-acetyltransferase
MERIMETDEKHPNYQCLYQLNQEQLGVRIIPGEIQDALTMERVSDGKQIALVHTTWCKGFPEAVLGFALTIAIDKNNRIDSTNPYCRRGITTALTEAALQHLERKGIRRVRAWTTINNLGARAIFEKTDFQQVRSEGEVIYWIKELQE